MEKYQLPEKTPRLDQLEQSIKQDRARQKALMIAVRALFKSHPQPEECKRALSQATIMELAQSGGGDIDLAQMQEHLRWLGGGAMGQS